MTPGLRSLFTETVESLLPLVRAHEEMGSKERYKKRQEVVTENRQLLFQSLFASQRLAEGTAASKGVLRALLMDSQEEEEEGEEEEGVEDVEVEQQRQAEAASRIEEAKQKVAEAQQQVDKAAKAAAALQKKAAQIAKRKAVARALAELEGPIVDGGDEEEEDAASDMDDEEAGADAPAAAAASSAAASAADTKPSPPAPKKPRATRGKKAPKQPASWLETLVKQYHGPASVMLDFLGGQAALGRIGTTSRSMRAAVKAVVPRLALRGWGDSPPSMEGYPHLQHLSIRCHSARRLKEWPDVVFAFNISRLQTFWLVGSNHHFLPPLVEGPWPQLQALEVSDLFPQFLTAVADNPAAVFPSLERLAVPFLTGDTAQGLLALLDRGAFPSLTALVPALDVSRGVMMIAPVTAEDMTQVCAVVHRLPVHGPLLLSDDGLGADTRWEPFAACILAGRLASLKCVWLCGLHEHVITSFSLLNLLHHAQQAPDRLPVQQPLGPRHRLAPRSHRRRRPPAAGDAGAEASARLTRAA